MALNADNIVMGLAQITVNGVDVGYVRGGVTVTFEKENREVQATQAKGIVKVFRIRESMRVTTNMLEATLENIRIAMNLPTASLSGSTLYLGYDSSCSVNEYEVIITGVSPQCNVRTITLYRCVAVGAVEMALTEEEETVIPVEFLCLKDPDNGNLFGKIVDA